MYEKLSYVLFTNFTEFQSHILCCFA